MASAAATAMAATAAAIPSTDEAWKVAQKLRVAIHKELEHAQNGDPRTSELARFEKVEKLMENYRLACIETIWLDIRGAREKNAEDTLWQTHTQVTKAYRKVLARLGPDHVVLKRKIEKLYSTYLKTSQYFYRGYLQRVCARFDMKDLRRIARQAELDEMPVPDKDKVDPAAAQLEDIVKGSCHKTLIYLGDLARYRTLLRSKDRKWDSALVYYFLANELVPESGYGHHQCGVIYAETEDHLQVVYHLYRALTCELPHPNAPANLEREFRDLQKRRSSGMKHALVAWFVKLHAFYSQGKEFSERKELESEVDHRLALAMKTGTGYGSDLDLLKLILINITAYAAAQNKIRASWTDEGSLSCQYILLLNIRTIQAIARLLGDEITDLLKGRDADTATTTDRPGTTAPKGAAAKFTPAFNRALPLLRVYMAWLCSYGSELIDFQAHLQPHLGTMCTALSNTLSLLFDLLGSEPQLGNPVSWRFPEDEMTLGIKCLNGPELHDGCQLYYDAFTRRPKPRREDVTGTSNTDGDDVTFTRALDVILCALDLAAPESRFPLGTSTAKKGPRDLTKFVYLEGGRPEPTPTLPAAQQPIPATVSTGLERASQRPIVAPSPCESNELSEDREFYGPNLRNTSSGIDNENAGATIGPSQMAPVTEFPIEKQLSQILNDFLAPPEAAPVAKPETQNHPAGGMSPYGIEAVAVPEAFGAGASSSPAPGSAGARAFPTLPWDYFYTPAPVDAAFRNSGTSSVGSGWGANGAEFSRPVSSGNTAQPAIAGNPLARKSYQLYDSSGYAGLVESQTEALQSLELGSDRDRQALQGTCTQSGPLHESLASTRGTGPIAFPQSPWTPSANPWQEAYGQRTAATGRVPNSPFPTLDFLANTSSSLPQVNSPWGLSTAAQGLSVTQSPASPRPLRGHLGASVPSPTGNRYAVNQSAAGAYAAAMTDEQASQVLGSLWSDARQPRSGLNPHQPLAGTDVWANAARDPAAEERAADGKPMMQDMPKR